jgi:hypothetical protein
MKILKTRDSAVAQLRKLGVKKEDYSKFVSKVDGGFRLDLDGAKAHLSGKKAKAEKPAKEPRITVTSVVEGLILDGKSNADVWAVIKPQFKLSDDKRWYPSWFRSRLKRTGRIITTKLGGT